MKGTLPRVLSTASLLALGCGPSAPGELQTATDPLDTLSVACADLCSDTLLVADAQTVATPEDTPAGIFLTGSDPNGEPLTYAIDEYPHHGALSGGAPDLIYTPAPDFDGTDSFTFSVNDAQCVSAPATVTIPVIPVNDCPAPRSQAVTTLEDTPAGITLAGADVEEDPLMFAVASAPAHGTLSGTAPDLVYTPDPDFNGTDGFTFAASDGQCAATGTVAVIVHPVNDCPVAQPQTVTTFEGTAVGIALAGSDVEGDPLTFRPLTAPASGALLRGPLGLTYAPAPGFTGTDGFTFQVSDGQCAATAAVTLLVLKAFEVRVPTLNLCAQGQDIPASVCVPPGNPHSPDDIDVSTVRLETPCGIGAPASAPFSDGGGCLQLRVDGDTFRELMLACLGWSACDGDRATAALRMTGAFTDGSRFLGIAREVNVVDGRPGGYQ